MLDNLPTEARAKLVPGKVHYATATKKLDDGRLVTCRVTLEGLKMDPATAKARWFVNGVWQKEQPT